MEMRLQRFLAQAGVASRRKSEELITAGRVRVNGKVVTELGTKVDPRKDQVVVGDRQLSAEQHVYLLLHKPKGYICSHDEKGKLIYDLLPDRWQRRNPLLSCAGRLDKESTGQVILTDDGDFLHRIIHPKTHAFKYYQVTLAKPLKGDEAQLFATGEFRMLEDQKPLKPAHWEASGEKAGVMRLSEGRFHQIRRMFATLGNDVVALHRFQTGGLTLGDLKEGEYRALSIVEVAAILAPAGN